MATDSLKPERGVANASLVSRSTPAASVLTFFLATYAVTWACWIPVVATLIPAGSPLRAFLWLLGVFAPSLVALSLTARKEVAPVCARTRVLQWRVGARWYLFAIGYMAAVKVTVALAHRVMTGSWPRFGHEHWGVILLAILISTPAQSGEEIGWRGYALPRLAERIGYAWGSVLLGITWACWHLPQFFLVGADTYRQSFPVWTLEVTHYRSPSRGSMSIRMEVCCSPC